MSEETPPDPLARLNQQIEQARRERQQRDGGRPGGAAPSPVAIAMRVGIELVAAFAVGVGLGLGFDYLVGTRPWGMIVGLFLGGAAGIMNVFRFAKDLGRPPPPGSAQYRQRPD